MKILKNIGPKTKAFIGGLAITCGLVLGLSLIQVSPATDLEVWAESLLIGTANAVGGYIVATLKTSEVPVPDEP